MGSNPRSGSSGTGGNSIFSGLARTASGNGARPATASGAANTNSGPRHYSFGRTDYSNIQGKKLSGPAQASAIEGLFGIAPGSLQTIGKNGAGGTTAAAASPIVPPPTAIANLPEGVKKTYYTDLTNMPATGGLVRPPAAPAGSGGPMQGAGLNWYVPPPAPRQNFATTIVRSNNNYRNRGGSGSGYGDRQ